VLSINNKAGMDLIQQNTMDYMTSKLPLLDIFVGLQQPSQISEPSVTT